MVSEPTPTASTQARSYWARRSAAADVIGVRDPGAALMRPSMLAAAFRITNGRPSRTDVRNG
jgi:hypothetical protein